VRTCHRALQASAEFQLPPLRQRHQAFLHEVQAQKGKSIDPGAADVLTADAQFLIDHCP